MVDLIFPHSPPHWQETAAAASATLREKAEFFHFSCTSEDINNLAYGMMLNEVRAAGHTK